MEISIKPLKPGWNGNIVSPPPLTLVTPWKFVSRYSSSFPAWRESGALLAIDNPSKYSNKKKNFFLLDFSIFNESFLEGSSPPPPPLSSNNHWNVPYFLTVYSVLATQIKSCNQIFSVWGHPSYPEEAALRDTREMQSRISNPYSIAATRYYSQGNTCSLMT